MNALLIHKNLLNYNISSVEEQIKKRSFISLIPKKLEQLNIYSQKFFHYLLDKDEKNKKLIV